MDLASKPSSVCQKCHSYTMKFDLKSQLFKCFNNSCGYIDNLTVITYSDETVQDKEENTKSMAQQINSRRYAFGQEQLNLNTVDYKEQIVDKWDKIRNEINACKKLIRKWCDFIGDKKIEFEIVQNFIEIVNLDKKCTCKSVKTKAASSFCFIIMKYVGTEANLQQIAETTNVSLDKILKEQQKIQQIKFSIEKNENILTSKPQNDFVKSVEWDKICFEYLQKKIFFYFNQQVNQNLNEMKKFNSKQFSSYKDVNLKDFLEPEEFQVFSILEQNIKKTNPFKISFERNKISSSMVLVFCLLTTIKELSIQTPLELSSAINLKEKTILKYYQKYIYNKKQDIIPKQDQWQRRKSLNYLMLFQ
ncbi:hypothetical protein TTHERM_000492589 (macronuclear) [Tetrahymena thermophila SB210]|uniref:Uncharacterized protein n=1 Tax=Tetrahymena thermophila (strain SB210) TaxID=312017 RepID=W7WZV6_TETTS|nr:hypothetical protein TTHERM_000492589 [Tetrahymena thermophila SB210]EWS72385.1 hypothetical protein TTHERM_000492589 [Tetrahymena thermophila SB210]|eukprot:XP_012655069.1 hypothetical protein TTHERM_000492589 [Tetrahymena thermophila SB210]